MNNMNNSNQVPYMINQGPSFVYGSGVRYPNSNTNYTLPQNISFLSNIPQNISLNNSNAQPSFTPQINSTPFTVIPPLSTASQNECSSSTMIRNSSKIVKSIKDMLV